MRRTDRLFTLIQLFRSGKIRRAEDLGQELGVSVRTVYRDIESLILSGIPIEGERGVGYIMREPLFLPPLTLTLAEYDALKLGVSLATKVADQDLGTAAQTLLDKISAVLPDRMRHATGVGTMAVYGGSSAEGVRWLPDLRFSIQQRRYVDLLYAPPDGEATSRRVRPLQVEFWGHVWTCTCWCELRQDFRVFRLDRIQACSLATDQYPFDKTKSLAAFLERKSEGWPP